MHKSTLPTQSSQFPPTVTKALRQVQELQVRVVANHLIQRSCWANIAIDIILYYIYIYTRIWYHLCMFAILDYMCWILYLYCCVLLFDHINVRLYQYMYIHLFHRFTQNQHVGGSYVMGIPQSPWLFQDWKELTLDDLGVVHIFGNPHKCMYT